MLLLFFCIILLQADFVFGINEEIIKRLSQASYTGSYQSSSLEQENYHNRSKYGTRESPRLKKLFGVRSLSLRKSVHNPQGVSYRTNTTITNSYDHWAAPRRSTVKPLKEQDKNIGYDSPSLKFKHHMREKKLLTKHILNEKLLRRSAKKTKQVTEGVKGFAPAEVDVDAVKLLEQVLKHEKAKLRHKIIIRKIEETKDEVEDLEHQKTKFTPLLKKTDYFETPKYDTDKIIETQIAIQKKLAEAHQLKYTIKEGVLYKDGNIPIAKFPSHSRPDPRMFSFNTVHAAEQTKVESSDVILEGTSTFASLTSSDEQEVKADIEIERSPPRIISPTPINISSNRFEQSRVDRMDSLDVANDIIEDTKTPPPYPFSHCYMNIDGFMCCNRYLESLVRKSYRKLKNSKRFNDCSIQKVSNRLQEDAQEVFSTPFETIVALDDFALRAHFAGDLMCKLIEDGHFITLYATAMPAKNGSTVDPLHVVTPLAIDVRSEKKNNDINTNDGLASSRDSQIRRSTELRIPFHELSREDIDSEQFLFNKLTNKV